MKYILLTCLCLVAVLSRAQKMPHDYFGEANDFFEKGEYDKALAGYRYITEKHPRNEIYPRAYFNIGYTLLVQKKYDEAIPVFKTILYSNFNEKENSGGGIMDDPYANYRHRASKILTDIYQEKKMYDTALYYLAQADSVHPYLHFCGNEYAAKAISTALQYADIYDKLNQPDKAIAALLPVVFETLASSERVVAQLKLLLHNRKGLGKELDQSIDAIYSREIKNEEYTYQNYYLRFIGTEIPVPGDYGRDKKAAIQEMKDGTFYRMIQRL